MSVNRKIFVELLPSTAKIGPAFSGVKGQVTGLSRHVNRQTQQMARSFERVGKAVGTFTRRLSAGLTIGLGLGVKKAGDFEQSMANVNSIAKQSASELKKTSDAVLGLNRTIGTKQRSGDLADALYDVNSAGFLARDGLKVLKEAALGADSGLATAQVAADGLTTELKAFNLKADDSRRAMDIMFKTVELGKITFDGLSQNVGKAATFLNSSGVSIEEFHAGLAVLTAKGLSAEEATVALRGAVKGILKPTKEAADLSDKLGLSYGKTALQQKGLLRLLQEMERATGGDTAQIATLLGDVRGLNAGLGLLSNDGGRKAVDVLKQMQNADGATLAAFAQNSNTLNFQMKRLLASLESVVIQMTQGFLPMLRQGVGLVQRFADYLASLTAEQKQMIAKVIAGTAAVSGLVGILSGAIAYLAAMKVSLAAVGISGFGAAIAGAGRILLGVVARINAVTLVVSALAAAWIADWKGIRSATMDTLKDIWSTLSDTFGEIIAIGAELAQEVGGNLSDIMDAFKAVADYVGDDFRQILVLVLEGVKIALIAVLNATLVMVKAGLGAMRSYVAFMKGDFKAAHAEALRTAKEFQEGSIRGWGRVATAYEKGEERIDAAATRAHKGLIERVREALGETEDRAKTFSSNVEGTFETLSDSIAVSIKDATGQSIQSFASMREAAEVESNRISEAFGRLGGGIVDGSAALGDGVGGLGKSIRLKLGIGDASGAVNALNSRSNSAGGHHAKKGAFSRSEASAFIRANAKAGSNLSGLSQLDDRTLRALQEGLKNAMKEGLELKIHSTFRKGSKGHHGSGQAFDASAFGAGVTAQNDARVIAKLFAGTGATAVIDENRQAVLNKTGGRGAHSHVTTGHQGQFQGTDGRDAVIPIAGGSITSDLANADYAKQQAAHKSHLEAKAAAQHEHEAFILQGLSEFNQQRMALAEQFDEEQERFKGGLISPEQLDESKAHYFAALAEIQAAQEAHSDEQLTAAAEANAAFVESAIQGSLAINEIVDANLEKNRELYDARIEAQIAEFNHQAELDQLTYEQKVVFWENMLALEGLSLEQRRAMETSLHELRKQHEQEALQSNQAFTGQITGTFQQFLVQTLSGQKKFSDTFKNLWKSIMNTIITYIAKAIIKALALKAILGTLTGGLGFLLHDGGVVGGAAAGASLGSFHSGGLVLPKFHAGGTVTAGGLFSGGLRPDEIVAKLQTGEAVLPRKLVNQLRSGTGQRSGQSINVSMGGVAINNGMDASELANELGWGIRTRLAGA